MIRLVVRGRRAVLLRDGKRWASFPADGAKWFMELFGERVDDRWSNMENVSKAYIFARVYPYTWDPPRLVKLLRDMDDWVAVYWAMTIKGVGMRAIAAFKRLFEL